MNTLETRIIEANRELGRLQVLQRDEYDSHMKNQVYEELIRHKKADINNLVYEYEYYT